MNVFIAPDKFKGSLSSFDVCKAIAAGIKEVDASINVFEFPMADGGDGFAAVLQRYWKTETINSATVDPLGREINASYQWKKQNQTAIIELAAASGLALLNEEERNPLFTSTYGTGLLIKNALEKGAQKIILGIGGSATNDGGTGILQALGFRFLDASENELPACGKNLSSIQKIISPPFLPTIPIEIACDVSNPLFGEQGAAFVYAPQKGATKEEVIMLDEGLRHFASIIKQQTGKEVENIPGAGAAGGIVAGLLPYLNVTLTKGIDLVFEASKIKDQLSQADLLFTGEGSLDDQSREGKVISSLSTLCKQHHVPLIALCGSVNLPYTAFLQMGITYATSIINGSMSLRDAMEKGNVLLKAEAARCIHFYKMITAGSNY